MGALAEYRDDELKQQIDGTEKRSGEDSQGGTC